MSSANAQNWNRASPQNFFRHLYQAIRAALPDAPKERANGYAGLRDAIAALARHFRFLLIIDEFEVMTRNPNFDARFFSNLRALGNSYEYNFGYLIASRRSLHELMSQHEMAGSRFWNIFGVRLTIGLLEENEARDLVVKPSTQTLTRTNRR